MRTTAERVLAVKLRCEKIESQKRIRTRRVVATGTFAASLLIIVGLSLVMPGLISSMPGDKYDIFGTAASMFDGSNFYGFVLIGFLAFALGVSVTILAYKTKELNQRDKEGK